MAIMTTYLHMACLIFHSSLYVSIQNRQIKKYGTILIINFTNVTSIWIIRCIVSFIFESKPLLHFVGTFMFNILNEAENRRANANKLKFIWKKTWYLASIITIHDRHRVLWGLAKNFQHSIIYKIIVSEKNPKRILIMEKKSQFIAFPLK